ncbi:MAG: 5-oxoprolinase subunit C family protein [Paracoccaceae bacterium]
MIEMRVHRGGSHLTVQDLGRAGFMAAGLSRGGAMDRLAVQEGAALLGQCVEAAAIEMAGAGGQFEADKDTCIALTGAPMRAEIDGSPLAWSASHVLPKGARLSIGGALQGNYGYLHVAGGVATPPQLDARATHAIAGLGQPLETGCRVPLADDAVPPDAGLALDCEDRFEGGTVRVVPSLQTSFFEAAERARFEAIAFRRDPRSSRMGVRLMSEAPGLASAAGLSVLSEVITPGDIQITGDGTPFVLMAECQTTGGYPRIGTVIPADLPRVAQAGHDAILRFTFVDLAEAVAIERADAAQRARLAQRRRRLVRRPEDMRDLLRFQLISGVTAGDDFDRS